MKEEFSRENIYIQVFNNLPLSVLIRDKEKRIISVNKEFEKFFNTTLEEAISKTSGEVLKCSSIYYTKEQCGKAKQCINCVGDIAGKECLEKRTTVRKKGYVNIIGEDENIKSLRVLVSASLVKHYDEEYILIVFEDISTITEIQGFITICCHCKEVHQIENKWKSLESFIEENSEAEFTHTICPNCMEKLYPDIYKKIK